jgi:hypothetical protein
MTFGTFYSDKIDFEDKKTLFFANEKVFENRQ